jgi:hypothetical protein
MQAIWMRLNVEALDKPIHIDIVPNIVGANASSCNQSGQVSALLTRLPQPHHVPLGEPFPPSHQPWSMPQISGYFETETLLVRGSPLPALQSLQVKGFEPTNIRRAN